MANLFTRSLATLAAVLAGTVFIAPAARAEEPQDILARAIKAHGEEALAKVKAGRLKSKGKIDIPGVGEADFTQETAYMIPDKFRDSLELSVAGQKVPVQTLINGDKVSIEVNGKAIELGKEVKEAIREVGHILQVSRLVPLKDKKYELSIIGEDKVEGKRVVGFRVSTKGRKDVSLYFDKETGLLTKLEYRTVEPTSGNEVTEERIVTEYGKNKDGIPVPKTVLLKRDGKKLMEAEILEIEMLESIDDSEFTK